MTTKITTSQIDAYYDADMYFRLMQAWRALSPEDEGLEEYIGRALDVLWKRMPEEHRFDALVVKYQESRAKPPLLCRLGADNYDPSTPRKFALYAPNVKEHGTEPGSQWGQQIYVSFGIEGLDDDKFIHVREVSETADAEIAEKLRNHDALCRAIETHLSNYPNSDLKVFMEDEGAKLP